MASEAVAVIVILVAGHKFGGLALRNFRAAKNCVVVPARSYRNDVRVADQLFITQSYLPIYGDKQPIQKFTRRGWAKSDDLNRTAMR